MSVPKVAEVLERANGRYQMAAGALDRVGAASVHRSPYLNPDLSAAREVPGMIKGKAEAGQLGMKTLGGIYPYTAEQVAERRAEIAKGPIAVRKTLSSL